MKSISYRKKNKGSALVLVLIATLLILSLSTVALSVSLSNVRMAGKVRSYNSEYYGLEKASQEVLSDVDIKLADAENFAIKYMEMELYKYGYYDKYNEGKSNEIMIHTLPEVMALKQPEIMQNLVHSIWLTNVKNPSLIEGSGGVINGTQYSNYLDKFFNEAYNRLFYNYAQKSLKNKQFVYNQDPNEKYGYKNVYTTASLKDDATKNYDLLTYSSTSDTDNKSNWDKFTLNTNDFVVNLKIMGTNDTYVSESDKNSEKFNGRKINAVFSIMPPSYEGVESTRFKNRRGNPIYTNAIVSAGNITFKNSNQTAIDGEIVSMSTSGGITLNNSIVKVEGNLCSANNVDINTNSKLVVNNFVAGTPLDIKQSLYGDKLFFDSNETRMVRVGTIPSLLEINECADKPYRNGTTSPPAAPIVFDDSMGGNTYCTNLNIQNGNANTSFSTRNILYGGKINFNSSNNSKVNIESSLITTTTAGTINEAAKTFDTNAGFGISGDRAKSKGYLNTIEFKRGVVGTILVNPGQYGKYNDYYKTYDYPITSQVLETYRRDKVLQNILNARTTHLGTVDDGFSGRISEHYLGVPSNVMAPDKIPAFDVTKFNASGDSGELNMLKHLKGNTTLNLNGKKLEGIIYCDGDLTINGGGSAEIVGALMCKGNVTINGKVKIAYSEAIIKKVLGNSKVTQDFFAGGERGSGFSMEEGTGGISQGTEDFTSTKARVRIGKNRYIITKWSRGKLKGN